MLLLVFGSIFIVLSIQSMIAFFKKNEWRVALLELNSELKVGLQTMQTGVRRRGVIIASFFFGLFCAGALMVLASPILQSHKTIVLVVLFIIFLWLLLGLHRLIRIFYSRKSRLLNYLFSPYLFAWKRDYLNQYSDKEIACAICRCCNIKDTLFVKQGINLKDFLIALHKKTRPVIEQSSYPKILEDNIKCAEKMWRQ
ncbi:MAG: hypothetical protein ABII75_07915 [Candidatus Omnitrophota bacterium]